MHTRRNACMSAAFPRIDPVGFDLLDHHHEFFEAQFRGPNSCSPRLQTPVTGFARLVPYWPVRLKLWPGGTFNGTGHLCDAEASFAKSGALPTMFLETKASLAPRQRP